MHRFAGHVGRQDCGRVAHFQLRRDRVGKRRFDDHLTDVRKLNNFAARRREVALKHKLICDDARERRADDGVAHLRIERAQMLLGLVDARRRLCAFVRIERARAQSNCLFGET